MANVEATIRDQSTSALVPVEGVAVTSTPTNPTAGQVLRQVTAVGDGGGATNYLAVNSSGAASVVVAAGTSVIGSVGSTTTPNVGQIVDGNTATQKLAVSAAGAASVAIVAGTTHIGYVGGTTVSITATPTVTAASAYAAKNQVGGLITLANAFGAANSGRIDSLILTSKAARTEGFAVHFFRSNPTNTTWADKTALAINAADIPYYVGTYALANPNSDMGTVTIYTLDAVSKLMTASGTSLYAVLETTGAPTFATTSDLTLTVVISQD